MIIQETSEVVELRVFQDLESVKSGSDLVRRRNFGHLLNRLGKEMMLSLDQGVVVSQEMLQLLDTGNPAELAGLIVVNPLDIFLGVEDLQGADLFVNGVHELFQSLEVQFELRDQLFS